MVVEKCDRICSAQNIITDGRKKDIHSEFYFIDTLADGNVSEKNSSWLPLRFAILCNIHARSWHLVVFQANIQIGSGIYCKYCTNGAVVTATARVFID